MSMSLTKSQYCDYEQGAVVSSLAHVSGRCAHMCTGGYVRCDAGQSRVALQGFRTSSVSEVNFIRPRTHSVRRTQVTDKEAQS
jgi:hypothetical protein